MLKSNLFDRKFKAFVSSCIFFFYFLKINITFFKSFSLPHRMKVAFKEGLIKAAVSTGAWIISGGTNTGVMRLVGEAVADYAKYSTENKLTVLGIATWGIISMNASDVKFVWVVFSLIELVFHFDFIH